MKVAIADDSLLFREGLRRLLSESGFSVAMACNFIGDGLRDAIDPRLRGR